jgi:hypothetical protein
MEWFILRLLVPAIVVPVVLLWGFAGCDFVFKLDPRPSGLSEPEGLAATPISVTEISLTWSSANIDAAFEIQRAKEWMLRRKANEQMVRTSPT